MSAYDLTGTNEDFFSTNNRFIVFELTQNIPFNKPVFHESIKVYLKQEDGSWVEQPEGSRWAVHYANRDFGAMSEARLRDESFDKDIVHSITIDIGTTENSEWSVEYQKLKLPTREETYDNNGPTPTPGLMRELIEDVDYIKATTNPVVGITSSSVDQINILDQDLTGINPNNNILNEIHNVNVPNGIQVIRTAAGSIYEHDLEIINTANSARLVKGVDYELIGHNMGKTKVAEHPSGVYDYIFIVSPYVGALAVSYRAFGGEVLPSDINDVKKALVDIIYSLNNTAYLTDETLPLNPRFTEALDRIQVLEYQTRENPIVHRRFDSIEDGKHWYSIGELYRDAWSTKTLTSTHMHLNLSSQTKGWNYDVIISINLKRLHERLRASVISSLDVNNHFGISEYEDLKSDQFASLRLVWTVDPSDDAHSGAVLQVGLNTKMLVEETLTIQDKSGSASWFSLYRDINGVTAPQNDVISLPNSGTWIAGDNGAEMSEIILSPEEGIIVWGGALPLTRIDTTNAFVEFEKSLLGNILNPNDINIDRIKSLQWYFYDRIDGRIVTYTNQHYFDDNSFANESFIFYANDLCAISYKLSRDEDGKIKFNVTASLGTHSIENDRFDLRQVVAHM